MSYVKVMSAMMGGVQNRDGRMKMIQSWWKLCPLMFSTAKSYSACHGADRHQRTRRKKSNFVSC